MLKVTLSKYVKSKLVEIDQENCEFNWVLML